MLAFWKNTIDLGRRLSAALAALVLVTGVAMPVYAVVTVSADPTDRFGTNPVVFTVDPFTAVPEAASRANRGVAGERRLRQTFQVPSTFNVGEINLTFDVTGGSTVGGAGDTGLKLAFFEMNDVLGAWTPGTPVKEITIQPGVLPATNEILRITLSGGDVFSLPQRNSGALGYGREISTPNALSSDGNPGLLWFTNQDGDPSPVMDYYAGGRYYTETGPSSAYRDVGLSLIASSEVACDPGDVNCVGGVTIDDLQIIAANFRTSGGREMGDLTGNGFIDFDDFGQWKDNYTGPGLAASEFSFLSVPEPTSALLILNGVLAFACCSRRRRNS
jgi:hypothetical protein